MSCSYGITTVGHLPTFRCTSSGKLRRSSRLVPTNTPASDERRCWVWSPQVRSICLFRHRIKLSDRNVSQRVLNRFGDHVRDHCVCLCGAKAVAYLSFQRGEGGMSTCGKILSKAGTGSRKLFQGDDRIAEHQAQVKSPRRLVERPLRSSKPAHAGDSNKAQGQAERRSGARRAEPWVS
jgi:hypothetical protein